MSAPFGDYTLLAYEVDCVSQTIAFRAQRPMEGAAQFTEVIFRGVELYYFESESLGTVLGWIVEHPLKDFIVRYAKAVVPEFPVHLDDYAGRSLRAYEVAPAAGNMRAWILAETYESRPMDAWPNKHLPPNP